MKTRSQRYDINRPRFRRKYSTLNIKYVSVQ